MHTDSGAAESGEGDVLAVLASLLRRFALADATEQPDPAIPPFQGGMIGFLGYDLAPLIERLPRRAPREPPRRLAPQDGAKLVMMVLDFNDTVSGPASSRRRIASSSAHQDGDTSEQ